MNSDRSPCDKPPSQRGCKRSRQTAPRRADGGRPSRTWPDGFDGWSAAARPGDTDAEYSRRFRWQLGFRRLNVELSIPVDIYKYCVSRTRTSDYRLYVADPVQGPFVNTVAEAIAAEVPGNSERDVVTGCVRFVQSIQYTPDRADTGHEVYPKYPIETLVHQQGDCEDGTLLLCALLESMGYETAVVVLPEHHHMVAGITCEWAGGASVTHGGTRFYTLETTTTDWDLGSLASRFQGSSVELHRPNAVPVLVHEWTARPAQDGTVGVDVHVANFGTGPAENVRARFLFEQRDSTIVEKVRLDDGPRMLDVGDRVQYTHDVLPPPDRRLRGRCRLIVDGSLHDETESEWH